MSVETHQFEVTTEGDCHVMDLTKTVIDKLSRGRIRDGIVQVFVPGSTSAITTTEFEPGLAQHDLRACFERLAPQFAVKYQHADTWNDDNGHAHVRASLIGQSVTTPLVKGRLPLGEYQQIVLIDFDTRPRTRQITVQVVGD